MRELLWFWRELIFGGALHGWPGKRCPDCNVRSMRKHKPECPTGKWDGGVWA